MAEVHCDQHIWTEAPWPHQQGARPGKPLLHPKASHPSQRVDAWAAAQPDTAWQRLKVRDSDQGWVEVSYLAQRVWVVEGDVQKVWWLLAWEDPDARTNKGGKTTGPRRHYALSNDPADEDPRVLVADGVERNVVERNFRDGKKEVGMADYQTRGWLAWHHHMALVMLALLFLTQERMHTPAPATPEGPILLHPVLSQVIEQSEAELGLRQSLWRSPNHPGGTTNAGKAPVLVLRRTTLAAT